MTDTFNPHDNKTSNAVVIVPDLMVEDYDRKIGWVVADDTSQIVCDGGWCDGDHWFTVEHTEGTTSRMNGTRLRSLTNRAVTRPTRPWLDPERRERDRLAVEDEHSHGGTATLDDGCGR